MIPILNQKEKKHLFAEADPSHPPPTLALEPLAHQVHQILLLLLLLLLIIIIIIIIIIMIPLLNQKEKKHLFAEADPSHPPPTLALEPSAHQVP